MTDEQEQETEQTFSPVTVTCGTDGCGNAGIAIEVLRPDDNPGAVVCGACGQEITDIT